MSWPPATSVPALDHAWEILADPDDRGREDGWFRPGAAPERWQSIALPCTWHTVLPSDYLGVAWLRTRLPDLSASRRHWLRFESVATDCAGWLDGVALGRHVGDWMPFQWMLPAGTRGGELVLRIDPIEATRPEREGDLQRGHITKGFHDVISMQHAGVWQPMRLAVPGRLVLVPDGQGIVAEPSSGRVRIDWTLEPRSTRSGIATIEILGPDGTAVARGTTSACQDALGEDSEDRGACGSFAAVLDEPLRWSPDHPALYTARLTLEDEEGEGETHEARFGFRTVETRGRTILLNGTPLHVRGVLDWGHEPRHGAPAPTPEEIRARFERLRAMGFNTVCLCMWYPPRAYYDIADETGMLLWQEHPVWQSRMAPEDRPEYRRAFEAFLRRDRNHPSIVITSATCEHPSFDPALGAWWWEAARAAQPQALLQLQTAFFRWADPERTDLHDEHTYESSDRWVPYLDDLDAHLGAIEPKPFVMGETVLFTSWPRIVSRAAVSEAPAPASAPWHAPRGFRARVETERQWRQRFGDAAIDRFIDDGDRFHLLGRKFQVEQFRRNPDRAGLVMNHLRDVPQCQCGFMDDEDRWRFPPAGCRPWLGDAILILETPDQRRAFGAGGGVDATVAISNFGSRPLEGVLRLRCGGDAREHRVAVPCGAVVRVPCACTMPDATDTPQPVDIRAELDGAEANAWRLWAVPEPAWPGGAARLEVAPLSDEERAPLETERAYSKGYGLDAHAWSPQPPEVQVVAAELPSCTLEGPAHDTAAPPAGPSVVLSHRLTPALRRWIEAGGAAVLLASGAADSVPTAYEWLFGQVPLVLERGPLRPGDAEWVIELLGYDLVRRWCRVMPQDLEPDPGTAPACSPAVPVEPVIRCAYTHDQLRVRELDFLHGRRLGRGFLAVTSLDAGEPIGRWLLARTAAWAAAERSSR